MEDGEDIAGFLLPIPLGSRMSSEMSAPHTLTQEKQKLTALVFHLIVLPHPTRSEITTLLLEEGPLSPEIITKILY